MHILTTTNKARFNGSINILRLKTFVLQLHKLFLNAYYGNPTFVAFGNSWGYAILSLHILFFYFSVWRFQAVYNKTLRFTTASLKRLYAVLRMYVKQLFRSKQKFVLYGPLSGVLFWFYYLRFMCLNAI